METALVGLLGGLIGLLLSNLMTLVSERRRRHERRLDLLAAIHAEILPAREPVARQLDAQERALSAALMQPFATPDESDFVFQSIKDDLTILPSDVIHEVVRYYRLARQSNLMTADLRHPQFAMLEPERREKVVAQLLQLLEDQDEAANLAIGAIEKCAGSYRLDLVAKRLKLDRRSTSATTHKQE